MKITRIVFGIIIGSLIGYYVGGFYDHAQIGMYIGGGFGLLIGSCNLIFGDRKKVTHSN